MAKLFRMDEQEKALDDEVDDIDAEFRALFESGTQDQREQE